MKLLVQLHRSILRSRDPYSKAFSSKTTQIPQPGLNPDSCVKEKRSNGNIIPYHYLYPAP